MNKLRSYSFLPLVVLLLLFSGIIKAQNNSGDNQVLNNRQQQIVTISSFTAKGDLQQLNKALHNGLDSGLTINEIKEVLVHLYAYCGFPRSLQGINTFMVVLERRKAKGIRDEAGKEATAVTNSLSKYKRGKKALETLTGQPEREPKSGYAAFSPVIDTFLKEHLFADIFDRDILSYADREIATVSALINLGGVEPMLQGHMRIALNLGISEAQLRQTLSIIEVKVGKEVADAGRQVLSAIINSKAVQNISETTKNGNTIFPKGTRITNNHFTGTAWLQMLVNNESIFNTSIGNVTFEQSARTNWHYHPGGQILMVTSGKGRYQEKGKAVRELRKGDVIKCAPNIIHWHGAAPNSEVSHLAIGTNQGREAVVWLQPVSDEEYNTRD